MNDFDEDPLDLIDSGDGGAVEMSILEEEEERSKKGGNKNSGCSIAFFLIGSSVIMAGWVVSQVI